MVCERLACNGEIAWAFILLRLYRRYCLIFGIAQAGGVFVPINHLLFPDQVAHIAQDCRMKGLITTTAKLGTLEKVLPDIPSLEFVVVLQDTQTPDVALPVHSFEAFCQATPLCT